MLSVPEVKGGRSSETMGQEGSPKQVRVDPGALSFFRLWHQLPAIILGLGTVTNLVFRQVPYHSSFHAPC